MNTSVKVYKITLKTLLIFLPGQSIHSRVLRDNLDETGASIWMRRGGRVARSLTGAASLASALIEAGRQSAFWTTSVVLIVACKGGRPRARFRSMASRRR